ncbi:hypothetical protein DPMN_143665 [Dreissena polymorpha]|uniref:Uncharacterized protein n=1 Tax=Dreissena polymorpha TaxID=45954 RepID=A0A9D4GGQ4_DREPO|nr:hypothetical protein DPMN_143665 [Dreissena polymorpha]
MILKSHNERQSYGPDKLVPPARQPASPPARQPAIQPARIRQSNNQFFPSENLVKNNLLIELILIFQEPLIMIIVEDKMKSLPQENVYRLYRQRIMLNSKEGKETLPKKDCMLVQTETSQVVVCIQRHLIYMRETMNNQP